MGLDSYNNTTLIPFPKASHSMINGLLKFDKASVGVLVIRSLNYSTKGCCAFSFQTNAPFFNRFVSGLAIFP